MYNYDASKVGVPYVRVSKVTIVYPDNSGQPYAQIEQSSAVKLENGEIRDFEKLGTISVPVDMRNKALEMFPMVNVNTGENMGVETNLKTVMLHVLAAIRNFQLQENKETESN